MTPLLLLLALLSSDPAPTRDWTDVPRDVYVDGGLDRNVQSLVTDNPRMFAFICGDEVVVFDPQSQRVSRAAKADFSFAKDRTTAKTPAELKTEPLGELVRPTPQMWLARAGAKSLAVVSHQSKSGTMSLEELWQTMPVWRAIADEYEPEAAAVARLQEVTEPVTLQVVMATWCGDSKKHVPRLLKTVERANNPNVSVELMGVGPDFESPMEFIQQHSITNVPTVIVKKAAAEIGRFVETPAGTTVEGDVCDILEGTMKPHPGRLTCKSLLATGIYQLRDARGRRAGTESFELYDTASGGRLVHSLITRHDKTGTETIDSWTTIDANGKPGFAEVTYRRGGKVTRTRFGGSSGSYAGHSRGAEMGIVDQTSSAPAEFGVITPATLSAMWASKYDTVYIAPEKGVGRFASRIAIFETEMRRGGDVPKRVRFADGTERRLVRYAVN